MNCNVEDIVEVTNTFDGVYKVGNKGTVMNIFGYGINILMDNDMDIRVINSDFPKYFKVI